MTVCWHKKAQTLIAGEAGQSSPTAQHLQFLTKPSKEVLGMWGYTWRRWSQTDRKHISRWRARYCTNICHREQTLRLLSHTYSALTLSAPATVASAADCSCNLEAFLLSPLLQSQSVWHSWCHLCFLFLTWPFLSVIESRAPDQALLMSWQ